MTVVAVLFNITASLFMFFCGMAVQDNDAPKYTFMTLFVVWLIFNTSSMLMLNR